MTNLLIRLSKLTYRDHRWVLALGAILFLGAATYGFGLFNQLQQGGFENPSSFSTEVRKDLERLGGGGDMLVLFTAKRDLRVTAPAFRKEAEKVLAKARKDEGVVTPLRTYWSGGGDGLVSEDGKSTFAVVQLGGDTQEQSDTVERLRPVLESKRLEVELGGEAVGEEEINRQAEEDLIKAEALTLVPVGILLLLIYGSWVAALLPLAMGLFSAAGAFAATRFVSQFMEVSVFSRNLAQLLALGLAIDYSLLVVSRFREERRTKDEPIEAALERTVATAGRTVLFSSATVVVALMALVVFPLGFLRSMAVSGSATVLTAALATITLLPAALAWLGDRVLSRVPAQEEGTDALGGLVARVRDRVPRLDWKGFSRRRMERPWRALILTSVVLLAGLVPLAGAQFQGPTDVTNLPPSAEARQVDERISEGFSKEGRNPIRIVVRTNGSPLAEDNVERLYDYVRSIRAMPDVKRVDSLLPPGMAVSRQSTAELFASRVARRAAQPYVRDGKQGTYALMSVQYNVPEVSGEARQLVRDIRGLSAPGGLDPQVGGQPAVVLDLLDTLKGGMPFAMTIAFGGMFFLLFLMLGSVVVAVKAIFLNTIALAASFGVVVLVFQEGLLDWMGHFNTNAVDPTALVLMAAVAFGLSMDYAAFLLSRVKEAWDGQRGERSIEHAVATGVDRTAGIITAAAVLLAVVIVAFTTGKIATVQQIGVGLTLQVLIDAFVVRMILVPASMKVLGERNWWAPAWMTAMRARLRRRLGVPEAVQQADTDHNQELLEMLYAAVPADDPAEVPETAAAAPTGDVTGPTPTRERVTAGPVGGSMREALEAERQAGRSRVAADPTGGPQLSTGVVPQAVDHAKRRRIRKLVGAIVVAWLAAVVLAVVIVLLVSQPSPTSEKGPAPKQEQRQERKPPRKEEGGARRPQGSRRGAEEASPRRRADRQERRPRRRAREGKRAR